MRIHITGIAGVLGSALAKLFVDMGFDVQGNDVVRFEEAWRLHDLGVAEEVRYLWKASQDLTEEDLRRVDLIVDCGLAVADRPLGTSSPEYTVLGNILPALRVAHLAEKLDITVIYPSSFNALYGHVETTYTETTPVAPTTLYGWTKAAVEELYRSFARAGRLDVVITRVGSAYGPRGRADELPHKLIIYLLRGRTFYLASPHAKRLWTYSKDVLEFYRRLVEKLSEVLEVGPEISWTLICAGNRGDVVVTNLELANMVRALVGQGTVVPVPQYERGELVYTARGPKPVSFSVDARRTRELLSWYPRYSLEEGLRETVEWFRENLHRYV